MIEEIFMRNVFSTLLANMPKDTRNMMTQSRMIGVSDTGTHYKIIITGPHATYPRNNNGAVGDYAYDVNYNKRRSAKEQRNYMYVERNIRQVAKVFGMVIK